MSSNKDWLEIQRMLKAGIIPSSQRIKDYLFKCCKEGYVEAEIDKVLGCVAQILRLEEERVEETDGPIQELLVLLESNKSGQELSSALVNISISPKEPKIVEF